MPEIVVTIDPGVPLAGLGFVIESCLEDIAEAVRGYLVGRAQRDLHTSSTDYAAGLQPVELVPGMAIITLLGWLPNAVENGWAGGDMKEALLSGRNAKVSKDGTRYNIVPFRHGTPGTSGANFPGMGSAYGPRGAMSRRLVLPGATSERAKAIGQAVYRAAKKLGPTTGHPTTATQWGARLPPGLAPKLSPHHKTDIYAGMVRQTKVYRFAEQGQYTTFRVVSDKSDPQSWIHPGIEPRHFFADASARMPALAGRIIGDAIRAHSGVGS